MIFDGITLHAFFKFAKFVILVFVKDVCFYVKHGTGIFNENSGKIPFQSLLLKDFNIPFVIKLYN